MKRNGSQMTIDDLRKIALKKPEEVIYPRKAMENLDKTFDPLKAAKNGKQFAREFWGILINTHTKTLLSWHEFAGLCQLMFSVIENLGPANQKSFKSVIPFMLEIKEKIPKDGGISMKELEKKIYEKFLKIF